MLITKNLKQKITHKLQDKTGLNNWEISGPLIESRECSIYQAYSPSLQYKIAIKVYRKKNNKVCKLQYETLEKLNSSLNLKNESYQVPKTFGCFPDQGIFLMEWIESSTLEMRLWKYFYSKRWVQSDINRTFIWLKEYHKHSSIEKTEIDIDFYNQSLKNTIRTHKGDKLTTNKVFSNGLYIFSLLIEHFHRYKTLHCYIHGDFTTSNVMLDEDRVIGIDLFGDKKLAVENDIALQLSYISVGFPNMLTQSDFKLPTKEWPLLKLIIKAYDYPDNDKQINFCLFVFLYQLLRRWIIINHRNLERKTPLLDRWRLRNTEMLVKNLSETLKKAHSI